LESDENIKDVFLVSSEARLVAYSGEGVPGMDETKFAELMEDLLFIVSSRRRYEDLFGTLQYLHIRHKSADTFLLPFERNKLLCICFGTTNVDDAEFVNKMQKVLVNAYKSP